MLALGLLSMLLVLTLLRDALLLAAMPFGLPALSAAMACGVPLLAAAAAFLGFVGARRTPRVREVEVQSCPTRYEPGAQGEIPARNEPGGGAEAQG